MGQLLEIEGLVLSRGYRGEGLGAAEQGKITENFYAVETMLNHDRFRLKVDTTAKS